MNTIRYLKRYFWGTSSLADSSAADGYPLAGAPSSKGPTTPASGASAAIDEPDGATVHHPQLPNLPLDIPGPVSHPASSAADPSRTAPAHPEPGSTSSAPTGNAGRPKLGAKRQAGRIQKRAADHTLPDLGAHVVIEKFDGPRNAKPKGYLGTVAGARIFASTVEDYCSCGSGGGHWLICGHEIVSNTGDTACGANCKTGLHKEEPFNCPQCCDTVNNIMETKFTSNDKATIDFYMSLNAVLGHALAVECVLKYLPTAKGNIAQTVMSIANPQFGRACQIVPAAVEEPKNLAEIFEEHRETIQQKAHARQVEVDIGPLTTHDKRKAAADEQHDEASSSTPKASGSPAVTAVADMANKKQKQKLEIHSEPITDSTRGIKRTTAEEDWSDDETLVDRDSPRPVSKNTKKQKQKLETVREPITASTRGEKRGLPESFTGESHGKKGGLGLLDIFYDVKYNQANKLTVKFRPFVPLPAGLGKSLRKVRKGLRKHVADEGENTHRNKRVCKWDIRPSEMTRNDALFAIKRMTLEEAAADYVDGDEL